MVHLVNHLIHSLIHVYHAVQEEEQYLLNQQEHNGVEHKLRHVGDVRPSEAALWKHEEKGSRREETADNTVQKDQGQATAKLCHVHASILLNLPMLNIHEAG